MDMKLFYLMQKRKNSYIRVKHLWRSKSILSSHSVLLLYIELLIKSVL